MAMFNSYVSHYQRPEGISYSYGGFHSHGSTPKSSISIGFPRNKPSILGLPPINGKRPVSWDYEIPIYRKIRFNVPNHQPVQYYTIFRYPIHTDCFHYLWARQECAVCLATVAPKPAYLHWIKKGHLKGPGARKRCIMAISNPLGFRLHNYVWLVVEPPL